MGHKQKRNRRILSKGTQLPSYNQIHGWNIRNRHYILGHESVQKVRFNKDSILDVRTHFKPTETLQYTNFYSCHPPGVTKGFIKGEALRLLRTNSSEITFEENMRNFSTRLKNRDYPATTVEKHLSEVIFADRKKALEQKNKNARKNILPFVTQYHPVLPNLQNILMGKWHLIQNQPYLRNIFKEPPLI